MKMELREIKEQVKRGVEEERVIDAQNMKSIKADIS